MVTLQLQRHYLCMSLGPWRPGERRKGKWSTRLPCSISYIRFYCPLIYSTDDRWQMKKYVSPGEKHSSPSSLWPPLTEGKRQKRHFLWRPALDFSGVGIWSLETCFNAKHLVLSRGVVLVASCYHSRVLCAHVRWTHSWQRHRLGR